jgi:hypothetical protein
MTTRHEDNPSSDLSISPKLRMAVAIGVLILYAILVGYAVSQISIDDAAWTRLMTVFASVSTLVAGAAGVAFGNQAQRSRAERAERRADHASGDASRGRALAALLKAESSRTRSTAMGEQANDATSRHAAMAAELFPNVD